MPNMDEQSDLLNPKSLEVCGNQENMDDEFEEYTEEEILSGEEQNEEDSSDEVLPEESADEVPCEEEPDDEESSADDSDEELEELEETLEEYSEEDIGEESEEEPDGKEPLRGSNDQPSLVNDSEAPGLLEQKKTLDAVVDAPQTSTRRRRSGWDIKAEDATVVNESGKGGKRRKTRWSSDVKAEASVLVNDSADVNKRRKTRWSSDEAQPGIKLPDSLKLGVQLQKFHAKLQLFNKKLEGDSMVNSDPSSPDENSSGKKKKNKLSPKHNFKFLKKLYVPLKEHPGYNFIGLLLGPRGNSLRKMEEETGATIRLRGKGSYLNKTCPHDDDDDLHVTIGADSQSSIDAAVSMVEKIFVPVDDKQNSYKAAQLRELAEIRGTLVGGKTSVAGKVDQCDICGMSTHSTSGCPLTATELKTDAKVMMAEAYGDHDNSEKQIIPTRVYVGRLPYSLSSDKLKELFLPYGSLCEATVMLNNHTGLNKGYGFVKYMKYIDAADAIEKMNGYRIDGKQLLVRFAGTSPPLDEPLPSNSGVTSPHSTPTANLPSSAGVAAVPPSSSNSFSYPGLAAVPPSSSGAKPPCYPRFATIPPSSSTTNLPTYPGLAATSALMSNLPSYPGFAVVHPSPSSPILPSYPGLAAIPSSSSANLLSYPGLPTTSSKSNLPSYSGLASMHQFSSNVNLPSYPCSIAFPTSSVNANIITNHIPTALSPSITKLPIFSGPDVLHSSFSNANLPSYSGFASIPPSSSATNLPSYPGLAAAPSSSNSNLPCFGLANLPSSPLPATLHSSSVNEHLPCFPGSTILPPTAKLPTHSGPVVLPLSPSNAYRPSFPGHSAIIPLSNAYLPSYPGFAAIPQKFPEGNTWPGPPGSVLPESDTSCFKSIDTYPKLDTVVPGELASFPGYLKSIDTHPLHQSAPSSSLSSQPPHFTRNFSGNQINPTSRNYNYPSSS